MSLFYSGEATNNVTHTLIQMSKNIQDGTVPFQSNKNNVCVRVREHFIYWARKRSKHQNKMECRLHCDVPKGANAQTHSFEIKNKEKLAETSD